MPQAAEQAARVSPHGPAPSARTLLDLINKLHQLRLDAVGLKLVDPTLATAVRRFANRVTIGVGNWPVWHALATIQDDTVTPPRLLQSSVFHVVDVVQLSLLHGTITSSAQMAPAFAAIEHIISFAGAVTDEPHHEHAHEPLVWTPLEAAERHSSAGSSPASLPLQRLRLPAPSPSPSPSASYSAQYAVPSFTSAPRIVPSSSRQSSAQPRLNESYAAFEAVLVQLSRVRPTRPLASVALARVSKAVEELEAAVPSSSAWEALSVVKPRGGLPGPHTSFQQQVMDRLHALVVDLRDGDLWTAEGIRLQVNAILGIIDEGKQLAGELKAWRSLSKRAPAGQLVSARTAARYRVSQEDLARRWR